MEIMLDSDHGFGETFLPVCPLVVPSVLAITKASQGHRFCGAAGRVQ